MKGLPNEKIEAGIFLPVIEVNDPIKSSEDKKPRDFFKVIGIWLCLVTPIFSEETVSQMLPLAVGNEWTYVHAWYSGGAGDDYFGYVTVQITGTEIFNGSTYFIFSEMPYDFPPVPAFFLAGKTVRWDDNNLLFLEDGNESGVGIYHFEEDAGYSVELYSEPMLSQDQRSQYGMTEVYPDTIAEVSKLTSSLKGDIYFFSFSGSSRYDLNDIPQGQFRWHEYHTVEFRWGIGLFQCTVDGRNISPPSDDPTRSNYSDHPVRSNILLLESATIGGRKWEGQFLDPATSISGTSWGLAKYRLGRESLQK